MKIRPILEYASELWCGEIPQELAEAVQTNFARTILQLQGQRRTRSSEPSWVLERLVARWEKLRLGYWRRIQVAKPERALVARTRRRQLRWEGGTGLSWMKQTRRLLRERRPEDGRQVCRRPEVARYGVRASGDVLRDGSRAALCPDSFGFPLHAGEMLGGAVVKGEVGMRGSLVGTWMT